MKISFICTGNTCRSPMAEGLLREKSRNLGLKLEVDSRGIFANPLDRVSLNSVRAMETKGIDISGHRVRPLDLESLRTRDLILTMTGDQRDRILSMEPGLRGRVFSLASLASGSGRDIKDPFLGTLDIYLDTLEELEKYIDGFLEKIN